MSELFRNFAANFEYMETIFDFNVTDNEKVAIGRDMSREEYFHFCHQTTANHDIAALLWMRGQKKQAEVYINRLPPAYKMDLIRTLTHS